MAVLQKPVVYIVGIAIFTFGTTLIHMYVYSNCIYLDMQQHYKAKLKYNLYIGLKDCVIHT